MGPTSPGGLGLGPKGPQPDSPEGGPPALDPTSWQIWWQFNRHPYLQVDRYLAGLETHSGSNCCLDERTIERQVLPFVEKILRQGADFRIMRNSVLALARMHRGGQASKVSLSQYVGYYLKDRYPELQEAGVLALGVAGDPAHLDTLDELLRDGEAGRKHMDGRPVPIRLRAYAAYAMGLIAERNPDEIVRQQVVHSLYHALGNERTATREVQVACVLAAGLAPMGHCGNDPEKLERHRMEGDRHMCGGVQLKYLLDVLRDDELDPWMRAHAAPAVGRLGLEAPDDFKVAAIEVFEQLLDPKSDEDEAVVHGAILGLGLVADGDDDELDVRARAALERAVKRSDPMGQRLALIGLGRAAARSGLRESDVLAEAQKRLLRELSRGRGDIKAWSALSLAVLGHTRLEGRQSVSEDVLSALRTTAARAKDLEVASAASLALGILRDIEAPDALERIFERAEDPGLRASVSLALGVIGNRDKAAVLRAAFDDEDAELSEKLDLSLALRLLGDRSVTQSLIELLGEKRADLAEAEDAVKLSDEAKQERSKRLAKADEDELSVEELEYETQAIVAYLGRLEDPSALPPLMALLKDDSIDDALRAEAIAAVGSMCDPEPVTWFEPFSTDVNYSVLTWALASPYGDGTGIFEMR
ncbi:MAG: hypothetical protein WD226_14210 [Planctomycetota bacterium]